MLVAAMVTTSCYRRGQPARPGVQPGRAAIVSLRLNGLGVRDRLCLLLQALVPVASQGAAALESCRTLKGASPADIRKSGPRFEPACRIRFAPRPRASNRLQ